tara:strand:+ start:45 stop:869 length:825 start_codon:yes stop_codon:yes gene_type:complete
MAVSESRVLPPEFIEAAGKTYLGDLATATGQFKTADLTKVFGPQFVAAQDPLQAQAQRIATQGIGAYQPFLNRAQAAQTAAGGLTGPQAYQQFMSPYQQDVIDTTLKEFDTQAAKGLPALAAQAINAGAFGGGREGVQRAEYQQASDRNRAALQSQLLQSGFGQAQQLAQQNFQNQMGLAQLSPSLVGQQISALGALGTQQQAQQQAQLSAQQQLLQQQANRPLDLAQQLGQGVTSLISGYPAQFTTQTQPTPSPLQTALGAGATLAGVYRAFS